MRIRNRLLACIHSCLAVSVKGFRFALVPKDVSNQFFGIVRDGCQEFEHSECIFMGTATEDPDMQAAFMNKLVDDHNNATVENSSIDGIAVSVVNEKILRPSIDAAVAAGIPVITFDSDAPSSQRVGYVGTNNRFFGRELASVLEQLQPLGGTVGMVGDFDNSNNIQARLDGFVWNLKQNGKWKILPPKAYLRNGGGIRPLNEVAEAGASAIVLFKTEPMKQTSEWKQFVRNHRNITIVSIDSLEFQLRLLGTSFVDGLVGQLPFEMGYMAMELLHDIVANNRSSEVPVVVGTNLLIHLKVPLELPDLVVQNNFIGRYRYSGYAMCCVVVLASLLCLLWIFIHRKMTVVTVSQPLFLCMVAIGTIITSLSFIPASFDDDGNRFSEYGELDLASALHTDRKTTFPCMAVPWLGLVGFSLTYAALFGKTWRIKTIFKSGAYARIKVSRRRVLIPLSIILFLNIVILTVWTFYEPQRYVRKPHAGTDEWNRIISTYGVCQSPHPARYLIPLTAINAFVLIIGTYFAYEARFVETIFAETKYIAIAMGSMCEACIVGIPILSFLRDEPPAYYLFSTSILFVTCIVTLGVIFIPKILHARKLVEMSYRTQAGVVSEAISKTNKRMDTNAQNTSAATNHSATANEKVTSFDLVTAPRRPNSSKACRLSLESTS